MKLAVADGRGNGSIDQLVESTETRERFARALATLEGTR